MSLGPLLTRDRKLLDGGDPSHGAPLGIRSRDVLLGARLDAADLTDPSSGPSDPGDAGALDITGGSGVHALTSGGAETRTLADPDFIGQDILIVFDVDGGDIVITSASGINVAANTSLTFANAGEYIALKAGQVAGALVWRVIANDGVVLA